MGGTNFSRIDELSDLVKKKALFLYVRRVEHRAHEHEHPMEGSALALKEIELYGLCLDHTTQLAERIRPQAGPQHSAKAYGPPPKKGDSIAPQLDEQGSVLLTD